MNQAETYNEIVKHIENGGTVVFSNYMQALQFTSKNVSMLSLSKRGEIYMTRRNSKTCLSYMAIRLYK